MPEEHGALKLKVPKSSDYSPGQADVPRAFREFSDSLAGRFTAASGRILVAQPSDVAKFVAMKGDATIDAEGNFALGSEVVTPEKFAVLPAARVVRESNQSIPNNTYTSLIFNGVERLDTEGLHSSSTNPDRIVVKVAGVYDIQSFFTFAGSETGLRNAVITVNAETPAPGQAFAEMSVPGKAAPLPGAGGNAINISATSVPCEVGDVIRVLVWQNSGGALNVMGSDGIHIAELGVGWRGPLP